ncbi:MULTISPECIES: hypothetical protein [unclassified Streptomyces]|uniref:hypothetical protein n=1 Tax=unclassified Streptomyces TaxID=2593676 RepID=UPI00131DB84B|nr:MULTISPECIES: hypothetical protein [unclassified Streptomyces]
MGELKRRSAPLPPWHRLVLEYSPCPKAVTPPELDAKQHETWSGKPSRFLAEAGV